MFRTRPLTWLSKILLFLALAGSVAFPQDAAAAAEPPPPPAVKAASAILVDAATGTVIWEKKSGLRRPMASTTKIMTAALILESNRLDDWVSFSKHARATEYANLNLKPGEQMPMRDLLYAILLRSSNEGCVAAAEHLAGSESAFLDRMNRKAAELGLADTNFVTTNGLYHKRHYSTAADLAEMTRYALRNPLFAQMVATPEAVITRSLNGQDTLVRNHNKLLARYPGADGVKTGYVRQSGRCLVGSSTRFEGPNPWRLIAVVLNSSDTYGDVETLMEWGRMHFQPVYVARKGEAVAPAPVRYGSTGAVNLVAAEDLLAIRPRDSRTKVERVATFELLAAPIAAGQPAGRLSAQVNGVEVDSAPLLAQHEVPRAWYASVLPPAAGSSPLALATLLLIGGYAKTAQGHRRRWRRIQAIRRRINRCRQGDG